MTQRLRVLLVISLLRSEGEEHRQTQAASSPVESLFIWRERAGAYAST